MKGYTVQLRGETAIRRALRKRPLPVDVQKRLVQELVVRVDREVMERAPGSLASAAYGEVKVEGDAVMGKVGIRDRTRGGFRYPWALESSKLRRYRYRSGPHVGKLTRGWVRKSRTKARKDMAESFERELKRHLLSFFPEGVLDGD